MPLVRGGLSLLQGTYVLLNHIFTTFFLPLPHSTSLYSLLYLPLQPSLPPSTALSASLYSLLYLPLQPLCLSLQPSPSSISLLTTHVPSWRPFLPPCRPPRAWRRGLAPRHGRGGRGRPCAGSVVAPHCLCPPGAAASPLPPQAATRYINVAGT